jgi:phenylacetate-CoA ligase
VPYYRQVFKDLGIDPKKMNFTEDWERLPVLEKDTLRARYQDLISETDHSKKARQNHSGGSTGKPVAFLSDLALYEMMAANMRLIFSWAGWKPGEMVLHLWGGKEKELPLTLQDRFKAWLSGSLILPVYSFDERTFIEWWKVLNSYKPAIIYAYPSVVAEFTRWLKEKGYEPIGIKGVFCSAEVLLPAHRKVIEEAFRCKVHNQYGSRETPCVACECSEGNMHLFVDLNRVEFLDQAEDPDGPKKIIVTPLHNYAQPLIRYDLGDLGFPKDGICPCGRGYPLMEMPLGRQNDHIRLENGKLIYPSYFIHLLDGNKWIRKFQFRQRDLKSLELILEADPVPDIQERLIRLKSGIMPKLRTMMGQEIELNVSAVPFIERTATGKHRFVINELEGKK